MQTDLPKINTDIFCGTFTMKLEFKSKVHVTATCRIIHAWECRMELVLKDSGKDQDVGKGWRSNQN